MSKTVESTTLQQLTLLPADSLALLYRKPLTDEIQENGCGPSSLESYTKCNRVGHSSKTSAREEHGNVGCLSCGAICGTSDISACHFDCAPVSLVLPFAERESTWLPRPTATANQLCVSMRKHPSCKNLQDLVGRTGGGPHPELWEWLMGFPIGWTDLEPSETP